MSSLIGLGKYLLLVPFAGFGLSHLMKANDMAGMVPAMFPGGIIWVYITGLCMLAAVVSALIGKYDRLAFTLLGILCLIFAIFVHGMSMSTNPMAIVSLLKDIGLAGGAWMYASSYARDHSVVG